MIITLPWMYHRKIVSIIAQCEREQVRVRIVPDIFQMTLSHLDVEDLGGIPMIGVREISISGSAVGSSSGPWTSALRWWACILLFPVWLLIALVIRLDSPGPVVFRQIRVGKDEKLFACFKFRSMRAGRRRGEGQAAGRKTRPTVRSSRCATIRASRRWAVSCGAPAWTNCRSCSTC